MPRYIFGMHSPVDLDFDHRYIPGTGPAGRVTLLLLHGTGGEADSLLQLGYTILPGATLVSPAGQVFENGSRRFFRRLAEGVFDLEDLQQRTDDLERFVRAAVHAYALDAEQIVAVGYSNGANIAASLLLQHPGLLAGAVLFRAMVPFVPERVPSLQGTRVLLCAGERDPLIPRVQTETLADLLTSAGADVSLSIDTGDHSLSMHDVRAARDWLATYFSAQS